MGEAPDDIKTNMPDEAAEDAPQNVGQDAQVNQAGARALANLLLLEHDFRNARGKADLAQLVVERLNRFTDYDCAVFWHLRPNGRLGAVLVSGAAEGREGKAMRQWGRRAAQFLAKAMRKEKTDRLLIDHDMLPNKLFEKWPPTLPMTGLSVAIAAPHKEKIKMGGVLLLRERGWNEATQIMIEQMTQAAGYSLRSLALGIYAPRHVGWRAGRRFAGRLVTALAALLLASSFFISIPFTVQTRLHPASDVLDTSRMDMRLHWPDNLALRRGDSVMAQVQGQSYRLVVEQVPAWHEGLNPAKPAPSVQLRVADVTPPALAEIDALRLPNMRLVLPLYVLRQPMAFMRDLLGEP